jgi:hypothetical protein
LASLMKISLYINDLFETTGLVEPSQLDA